MSQGREQVRSFEVAGADDPGDGRVRRRTDNRAAVVETLRTMILGGAVDPTIEEVAEVAGVSVRSIQRYFGSLESARDELRGEIVRIALEHLENASGPVMPGASLEERCASVVASRFEMYDRVGAMIRNSRSRFMSGEESGARFEMARALVNAQIPERFELELSAMGVEDRAATLAVLDVLLSFDSIDGLLADSNATRSPIGRVLINQLVSALQR
ncbi:MAG: TetR/AcrR family transcriptional regulator [Ilumatobacter sp.]